MPILPDFSCVAASVLLLATMDAHAKRFKVAVGDAGGSAQHELGEKFAEEVKRLSDGKHRVKLFLNGQLGSEQDTVNDAALGTLDLSLLAINNITPFSPTVGIFTLPYVILSLDDAVKLTQGPIGQELVENTIRDAKVRIIGWTYTGLSLKESNTLLSRFQFYTRDAQLTGTWMRGGVQAFTKEVADFYAGQGAMPRALDDYGPMFDAGFYEQVR